MERRKYIQNLLSKYSDHVYFQPGPNTTLVYPCIVYTISDHILVYADNRAYTSILGYDVTYISKDPEPDIPFKMIDEIPYANFKTSFISDNLSHTVFTVYSDRNEEGE